MPPSGRRTKLLGEVEFILLSHAESILRILLMNSVCPEAVRGRFPRAGSLCFCVIFHSFYIIKFLFYFESFSSASYSGLSLTMTTPSRILLTLKTSSVPSSARSVTPNNTGVV